MSGKDNWSSMIHRLELRGGEATPDILLQAMLTIRAVETALMEAYLEGRFEGPLHVSLGQEGAAVGVVSAMGTEDVLVSNHRGHGHVLAFGLDPLRVVAEIVCDPCGYAGGRGGSMHIFDPEHGFLGTNGIVGDGAGLAVGAALAIQQTKSQTVSAVIMGDGAMGTGIVYEAFNLASLWHLPVVFVCENNQYAEMTPTEVHLSSRPHSRAEAFRLSTFQANGDDVESVMKVTREAIEQARAGNPAFVEVSTYRWGGHYVGDPALYRPEGEEDEWRNQHDPVRFLTQRLGAQEEIQVQEQALLTAARELVAEVLSHDH